MLEWKSYIGLTNFEQTAKDMLFYVEQLIDARAKNHHISEKILFKRIRI